MRRIIVFLGCVCLAWGLKTQPTTGVVFGEDSLIFRAPPVRVAKLDNENDLAGYYLSVAPSQLSGNGQVTISWATESSFTPKDFISVTCGPAASESDFLDRRILPENTTSLTFSLYDLHCDYELSLHHWNPNEDVYTPVAKATVQMKTKTAPTHLRIAFGDDFSSMWVSFTTYSNSSVPMVHYGTSHSDLSMAATGSSRTYTAEMMCNAPANMTGQTLFRDPGYTNDVLLTNLKPNTRYYYKVGSDAMGWSSVRSFLSASEGGDGEMVKFLAWADMGVFPAFPTAPLVAHEAHLDAIEADYNAFVIHFGDISYARSKGYMWDLFHMQMDSLASSVPYMVSIGNHEYDHIAGGSLDPSGAPGISGWHPDWGNMGDDSSGECAVPVYYRFKSPSNGNGIFWYSFDYGIVHVIQMSSEHDWTRGSKQYQWLEDDLAAVNRTKTPWIVLTTHRMLYTTQLKEDADWHVSIQFRAELDPLLEQYKVNLVLCGHQHSYERSCPVLYGNCVENGPVHVIVGTAGAGLESGGFSKQFGNWSVYQDEGHHGYTRIEATREEMVLEYIPVGISRKTLDETHIKPWL